MSTLTVTDRGQVTLRKDVLRHMGLNPGDKLEAEFLPNGRILLTAARPSGSIKDFFGLLAGKTDRAATVADINEAIAAGWAGEP